MPGREHSRNEDDAAQRECERDDDACHEPLVKDEDVHDGDDGGKRVEEDGRQAGADAFDCEEVQPGGEEEENRLHVHGGLAADELALVEKEYVEPEKDHGADEAQHHDELRIQAGFVEQLGEDAHGCVEHCLYDAGNVSGCLRLSLVHGCLSESCALRSRSCGRRGCRVRRRGQS